MQSENLKRILMINPQASPKMPYDGPPLSILAPLCKLVGTGRTITVLDWHYANYEDRIRKAAENADVCGITCMTGYQIKTMLEAARIAKASNPRLVIVCGGAHPTLMPEQTLRNNLIDVVVIGQGPTTFQELIEALEGRRELSAVRGIGWKKDDGQLVINEARERENISDFSPVPYHLLEHFEDYIIKTSFAERTLYYLSAEGCPGACKFCAEESLYHRRWRGLPVDRIIADIRAAREKYDFDGVAIADSNFYVNEKRVVDFCTAMKPLGLKWGGTSGRPDQLARYKDETFALMKASGLSDIFLGVESGDDQTLELMGKGCVTQQTLDVLPRLHKHGIRVQCSFIIGVPGVDVRKDFKSTMRFINRLRKTGDVSQFHLFVYTPLPGTRFMADAQKLGYKIPENLEDWTHYELHAHTSPWIPKRYALYTDAASVYFMFLARNTEQVVRALIPRPWLPLALLAERLMYGISLIRVSTAFFFFPIEFRIIKWVLMHKSRLFPDKKIMF